MTLTLVEPVIQRSGRQGTLDRANNNSKSPKEAIIRVSLKNRQKSIDWTVINKGAGDKVKSEK